MSLTRDQVAARLARDIVEGWHVNLGIGWPELVANHIPDGREVILHSENGILGMGPTPAAGDAHPNMINAGKKPITAVKGASFFDHAQSFGIVRGGHLDLCVLGAYQAAPNGDLANWSRAADDLLPSIGGAMDLAAGAQRIFAVMTHCDKNGTPKLRATCDYPLTGAGVVSRIFTELAVVDVADGRFTVTEMAAGLSRDDLIARTDAPLSFAREVGIMRAD